MSFRFRGKKYRLTRKRKLLLTDILVGAGVIALLIWVLQGAWDAFLYGPMW
jgi:hypothetical protein